MKYNDPEIIIKVECSLGVSRISTDKSKRKHPPSHSSRLLTRRQARNIH